ncbi:MAG: hypothetical protein KA764_22340, partial [Anaerolineales bacterium]|nr:hypothetical protein [Anaerolineales bacterium]
MLLLKVIHTRVLALTARGTPLQPALARFRPPAVLAQSNEPLGLGWLPLLSLLAAGGLLCVAVAFTYSRAGSQQIEPLFWLGLLLIVVPGLIRLAGSDAERAERLSLVILIGLSLYLVKVMHSPYAFTYSDEFLHAFNTQQILTTGRLFTVNPILTVSALYPGLPLLTAALTSLTGLSVFQAGLVVIGTARLILMLALFVLYEQIGASPRVAGLGVLLYAANANFVYWSSQFGYESLSLPLAVLVLYLVRRRQTAASAQKRLAWTLAAALGIGAVVITHHLTSYFLVVFLLIWTLFHHGALGWLNQRLNPAGAPHLVWLDRLRSRLAEAPRPEEALRRREPHGWDVSPALLAAVALLAAGGWLVLVAGQTVNYLFPVLGRAVGSVVGLIAGEETSRELFRSTTGYVAPVWERVAGISSVVLALIGL